MSAKTKFPTLGLQILSAIVQLLGVSLLTHFVSRRVRFGDIKSFHGLKGISWTRLLILLAFIDSWLFIFTTGVLIHGAGLETNVFTCTVAIGVCIAFYVSSKVLIWLFLAEKVHVVWSSVLATPRHKSPAYLVCFVLVAGYVAVGIHLAYERVAYFRDDGVCIIGLTLTGSLLLLSFDISINVIMTLLFLWPLVRSRLQNLYLRKVARRAVITSLLTLLASVVNIAVLIVLHGHELGWLCLTSCGVDVIANASVLFWVTSGSSLRPQYSVAREGLQAAVCVHCNDCLLNPQIEGRISPKDIKRIVDRTSASINNTLALPQHLQPSSQDGSSSIGAFPDLHLEMGRYAKDSNMVEDPEQTSATANGSTPSVHCKTS